MLTRQDLVSILKLLAIVWVGLLFVVAVREVAGNLTLRDWNYDASADLSNVTLRMWLPWLCLSPLLVIGIKRFLFYPETWIRTLLVHLVFVMLFIFTHLGLLAYHYQMFEADNVAEMRVYAGWQHMGHFVIADPFILTDFIVYVVFLASFNMSNFTRLIRQKEQDAMRLESSLTAARLHALQMQVNPHFLFNTLNSISVLVQKKDFSKAAEMIHRLSDFFRTTLEKSPDHLVPLESELELVGNYLAIEQVRFEDRLTVRLDVDPRTLGIPVPAMLLQPLVENSLRHGINALERPGVITIRSRLLADRLLLEVRDNGAGCTVQQRESAAGIGLSNVRQRLQQIYDHDFVFRFDGGTGKGVIVTIEIPAALPADCNREARLPDQTPANATLRPREA